MKIKRTIESRDRGGCLDWRKIGADHAGGIGGRIRRKIIVNRELGFVFIRNGERPGSKCVTFWILF